MRKKAQSGFSFLEIMMVLAMVVGIYVVVTPNLNFRSVNETATKLASLGSDFRSAFDLTVLTGKPHRLVFVLGSPKYHLEVADRSEIELGGEGVLLDPTAEEDKAYAAEFDAKMKDYEDLAGRSVPDAKGEKEIPPDSPVLKAKNSLKRANWSLVDSGEWGERSMGSTLMFRSMRSEHHLGKIDAVEQGREVEGMIYFFPNGYVQKAYLHIYYVKDEGVPDDTVDPYTLVTKPFQGTAVIEPGYKEVDLKSDEEATR